MSSSRLSAARLLWLEERLSPRDWCVLEHVSQLRLATGQQLEVLCFDGLAGHSRTVVRGRVLSRLVDWGLLEQLDRRIGGAARGSSSAIFRLAVAGQRLMRPARPRATKPYSSRYTSHTLAISQVLADLVRHLPSTISVPRFETEPASWHPDGLGGRLKPDAYLQIQSADVVLHWWLEVDRSTESLPTLSVKLRTYLDFVARGQVGPAGLVPRVMVSVNRDERLVDLQRLAARLPPPAAQLFVFCRDHQTALALLSELRE
jgi:hypothetical protein